MAEIHHPHLGHDSVLALIEQTADLTVILDSMGIHRYVSASVEEFLGYSPKAVLGWDGFEWVHPEDVKALRQTFHQALHCPGVKQVLAECRLRHHHGYWCDFKVVITNWLANPLVQGIVVGYQDNQEFKRETLERQRAQEVIRESWRRYRSVIDTLKEVVFQQDIEGRWTFLNPAWTEITGFSIAETLGHHFLDYLSPDDRDSKQALFQEIVQGQQRFLEHQVCYRTQGGEDRWFDASNYPLLDASGRIMGVSGILHDITEQRLAQKALQASESRFQRLVANVPGVLYQIRLSPDGALTFPYINPGCQDLFGLTAESVQQDAAPLFNLIHPEDLPSLCTAREASAQYLLPLIWEGRMITPSGQLRWIRVTSRPERQETGDTLWDGLVTEITELKQAEASLKHQVERERLMATIAQRIRQSLNLEDILQTMVTEIRQFLKTDRVLIYQFASDWSGEVVVESVTPPWDSLLGHRVQDMYFAETHGQEYCQGRIQVTHDVEHSSLTPCHGDFLRHLQVKAILVMGILQGQSLWGLLAVHHCTAPRHWAPWEVEFLEHLAIQGGIAIQQAALYRQLERSLAKEKDLNELKSRFVHTVSHEFRTPLATIMASSDLLKQFSHKLTPESKLERLNKIQAEVKNMTRLLEDVLFLGKVEAGRLAFQPLPLEVGAFSQQILAEMAFLSYQRHDLVFQGKGAIWAEVDEQLLRQILTNLLSNAIKYSPQGGKVTLTVTQTSHSSSSLDESQPGPQVVFQIEDQGIGISEADQAQLFEEFYRASNVSNIPGTGLGLSIVKQAVDLHRGSIQVESVVEKGTMFTVTLPLKQL